MPTSPFGVGCRLLGALVLLHPNGSVAATGGIQLVRADPTGAALLSHLESSPPGPDPGEATAGRMARCSSDPTNVLQTSCHCVEPFGICFEEQNSGRMGIWRILSKQGYEDV